MHAKKPTAPPECPRGLPPPGTTTSRLTRSCTRTVTYWGWLALVCLISPASVHAAFTYTVQNGEATITGYTGPDLDLVIPETMDGYVVVGLANNALSGKSSLTSVSLPDTLKSIGAYAFQNCRGLSLISMPAAVTAIGGYAFKGCTALTAIEVHSDNISFESLDGVLYTGDMKRLLVCPPGKAGEVLVPDGVQIISGAAFEACTRITKVRLPASATEIGIDAFRGCWNLEEVNLPEGLPYLGGYLFYECAKLKRVTIPESVTNIFSDVFRYCRSLDHVRLPQRIGRISLRVFEGCSTLSSITVPNSVTNIGFAAFWGCTNMTSATIGSGVTGLGDSVFQRCSRLRSVAFEGNAPTIGINLFELAPMVVVYRRPEATGWPPLGQLWAGRPTASLDTLSYSLQYAPGAGGSVSGAVAQTVGHGMDATPVLALPADNHRFVEWSDGLETPERHDMEVTGNLNVTAIFVRLHTLAYAAGPDGSLEGELLQVVAQGGDGSPVVAVPDEGHHFVEWSDGSSAALRQDRNVTQSIDVTASFDINRYSLIYNATAGGALEGDTAQLISHGSDGTDVTALPDAGAVFAGWSDGVEVESRRETDVVSSLTVTAAFHSAAGVPIDWYALYSISPEPGEDWGDVEARYDPLKRMTLVEQYIADLDPTQPNHVFRVIQATPPPHVALTVAPSSPQRVYTLFYRHALVGGEWIMVPSQDRMYGGAGPLLGLSAEEDTHYRIRVELP